MTKLEDFGDFLFPLLVLAGQFAVAQRQFVSGEDDRRQSKFDALVAAGAEMLPRRVEDQVLDVRRGGIGGHGVHESTHQALFFREILGVNFVFVWLIALILGLKKERINQTFENGGLESIYFTGSWYLNLEM